MHGVDDRRDPSRQLNPEPPRPLPTKRRIRNGAERAVLKWLLLRSDVRTARLDRTVIIVNFQDGTRLEIQVVVNQT